MKPFLRGNWPEVVMFACLLACTSMQLQACAGDKALVITGESLVALGVTFEATAAAMDTALDEHRITPEQYSKWRTFGLKFQQAYPLAAELWKVADDTKDEKLLTQAGAAVAQLGADLAEWAALMGVK